MAEQEGKQKVGGVDPAKNPEVVASIEPTKDQAADSKLTRVSKKIDKNNVEVTFGKDAKEGKFSVYDRGVLRATVEREEKGSQVVPLSRYLESGVVHDFVVIFE